MSQWTNHALTVKNKAMKKSILIFVMTVSLSAAAQNASEINSKGFRQAKKGNYARAVELFSRALELNPYYTEAWYNRALAQSKLKEYSKAIQDYTQAIELRPHFK